MEQCNPIPAYNYHFTHTFRSVTKNFGLPNSAELTLTNFTAKPAFTSVLTTMSEEKFDGYGGFKSLNTDSKPEDCRKLYAAWSETYDKVCLNVHCEIIQAVYTRAESVSTGIV